MGDFEIVDWSRLRTTTTTNTQNSFAKNAPTSDHRHPNPYSTPQPPSHPPPPSTHPTHLPPPVTPSLPTPPISASPSQSLPFQTFPMNETKPTSSSEHSLKNSSFARSIICCVVLIVILLFGVIGFELWSNLRDNSESHLLSGTPVRLAELPAFPGAEASSSGIHQWVLIFETGTVLQEFERHPEIGGIEGLLNFSSLVDFNICCATLTHRFVCMGGSALGQSSSWFSDAYLEQEVGSDDIFLVLRINSKELISVTCHMTITTDS